MHDRAKRQDRHVAETLAARCLRRRVVGCGRAAVEGCVAGWCVIRDSTGIRNMMGVAVLERGVKS